ncbi:hypothetical protein BU25DRAFT_410654 [Macroventuria anomochaeta]|uniref:Uncharacterized protein n=1 Tax=Macroventuria anomochaeta TaxID=301207 RepID=A0ACB6S0F1_9PLEO|nr:uncharacterized protein BU25DRAFT_410654 [Macroventuria anomochaeta]KAF2627499.1 hypothetical protein BU25DRAFT_410654 [Macroventuria anomochaeta]
MASTTIQHFDTTGVLHSVVLPRSISSQEIERFQEYLQNTGINSQNLSNEPQNYLGKKISGGPYECLTPEEAVFLEGLGWQDMWIEEERTAGYLGVSSEILETERADRADGLTVEEAEYLQGLGWFDNELSSSEEDFLRENDLEELVFSVKEEISQVAEDLPALSDTTGSEFQHRPGCLCKYPWTCNPRPEPPSISRHPQFAPIGKGRLNRKFMSPSPPSSASADSSPPTSIEMTEVRRPLGSPFSDFLKMALWAWMPMDGRVPE